MSKLQKVLCLLIMLLIVSNFFACAVEECKHVYTKKITQQPSCITEGLQTSTCALCGDSYTEVLPISNAHKYKSEITKEPSCKSVGEKAFVCAICNDSYMEELSKNDDHKYISEVLIDATCDACGKERSICSLCGAT